MGPKTFRLVPVQNGPIFLDQKPQVHENLTLDTSPESPMLSSPVVSAVDSSKSRCEEKNNNNNNNNN